MFKELHMRSIIKTITFRIIATITTILLVVLFTGNIKVAISIGLLEVLSKLILYYFHERLWGKIKWGIHEVKPFVIWFTGLSGSGKSALAIMTYKYLQERKLKVQRLDGDAVRSIFPTIGFDKKSRNQHIKRVGYLASILKESGAFVVASFISPYNGPREFARKLCKNFILVYVATPIEICEERDTKGLYTKARAGEIENFTGISAPYEIPDNADIVVGLNNEILEESFEIIKKYVDKYL